MDSLVKNDLYPIDLKQQLKLFLSISLGVFLFILFFQPFELIRLNVNDRLLFTAGLGAINFFFMWIFRIFLPWSIPTLQRMLEWKIRPKTIIYISIWIFSSAAFAFYLRYVGHITMSMYLAFKIVLVNLAPPVIIWLYEMTYSLRLQLKDLFEKYRELTLLLSDPEKGPKSIETFISDTSTETITLLVHNIVLLKSADNYVKIVFKDQEKIIQKLIRNTFKNIEAQLKKYPDIIRCHRTCIVNRQHVLSLYSGYAGYRLKMLDYDEEIPVSRQYLLHVRESVNKE